MPSESHKKAQKKWDKENMANLSCRVKKEQAERFKEYAAYTGTTTNALLKKFVLETIQKAENPQDNQDNGD